MKKENEEDLVKEIAKVKTENLALLEKYATTKHEKEVLIKAIKIIINHQE